jgi:hypothetical protein
MPGGHRVAPIGPYPEGMYGIFAEIKVYLVKESDAKEPSTTLVGRIEKHLEQEVERLASSEFLSKIQGVLQQAGMKRVITINKNDVTTYSYDSKNREDWDEVFEAALKDESSSKGIDEWWIVVSGWTEEFRFRQTITFKAKHTLAAPSMTLEIRALPAEWALQSGENFDSWMERLKLAVGDKDGSKSEEIRVQPRIEKYLQDYQLLLKGVFAVRDLSQNLRINLSGIDMESFRENYDIEQCS